jgi:hypothetical protein
MAINPPQIGSSSIKTNYDFSIEILTQRPYPGVAFTPNRPVGQVVGYYDPSSDSVELYIVNQSGNKFLRIS